LVDEDQCKLDAALMQELGANTIRVYHVDPSEDHDGCMTAFADAGIYLFVDLETFDTSISQVTSLLLIYFYMRG
jgi:1,3-beta-glucanosyltransferase GAS1